MQFVSTSFQWMFYAMIATLFILAFRVSLEDPYANTKGKLLALMGALLMVVGVDTLIPAICNGISVSIAGEFPHPEEDGTPAALKSVLGIPVHFALLASIVGFAGVALGLSSSLFTRPEMVEKRNADIEKEKELERNRKVFLPRGNLLTVRNHNNPGGLLSNPVRFTEIETSDAVFVVEGEVGSVSKGVPVYTNALGQLRIGSVGSRSYTLRT